MAALDKEHLIVRVAYAGAPMAGKTESVRALMPLLKGRGAEQRVLSPAEERGRTAFFDWGEYEGGAFEGKSIRVQITSAPGQVALSDRREILLRGADAVILVVDSRSEAVERAQQCYEEMAPWLAEAGRDVPIRVLLQCNKQDLPRSLTPEELSGALGLPFGKDIYGTSARTGKGLRAAFVGGVRAAVERAKELIRRGLIANAPEIASGEELLELMQRDAAFQNLTKRREPPGSVAGGAAGRPRAADSQPKAPAPRAAPEPPSTARARPSSLPARAPSSAKLRAARRQPESSEPRSATPPPAARTFAPFESGAVQVTSPPVARPPEEAVSARAPQPLAPGKPAPSAAQPVPPKRISWAPESGTRPAVLPASVYYAAMARLAPAAPAPLSVKSPPRLEPARAGAPQRPRAPSSAPGKLGLASKSGGRPAVMPASAFYASLAAAAPLGEPGALERLEPAAHAAKPFRVQSGARPAVLPASAWRAAEALRAASGAAQPLEHAAPELGRPLSPEEEEWVTPDAVPSSAVPSSAVSSSAVSSSAVSSSESEPRAEGVAVTPALRRPAVVPSSAWLAQHAQHAAARAAAASARISAPPARRGGVRGGLRPAVMPADDWAEDPSAWVAAPPASRRMSEGSPRPAVMPASAWRASLASMFRGASPANETERAASERPTQRPPSIDPPSAGPHSNAPPSVTSHSQNGIGHADDLASGPFASPPSSPLSASSAPPGASPSMRASGYAPAWNGSDADASVAAPQLPGRALAPRTVWPRNIWRMLEPQVTPHGRAVEDARGRWLGELAPGWYGRTLETAPDLRSARRTFAGAVLRHRRLKPHLSAPRCLALTEEADRCWVWQIVYRVPTLAATLGKVLATREDPDVIADALVQCAAGYLDARERFGALVEALPLSLHALSVQSGQFVYAGLLPNTAATLSRPVGDPGVGFQEALRKRWPAVPRVDVQAILGALQGKAAGKLPDPIVDVIRSVLIGQ